METFIPIILQIIIALGIFNVWVLRFRKASDWRGGAANNMQEEFETYGLPDWSMKVVGALKLVMALMLVIGIWYEPLVLPAALGIAVLMVGAIGMHVKIKDPLKRSLPALSLLLLSLLVAFL
jgi:uncharacterized membrane protein YphA (DoxX/SURF4 family)